MADTDTTERKGVIAQHRDRMDNDPEYREAALTPPATIRGKHLSNDAPTSLTVHNDASTAGAGKQVQDGHVIRASDATNPLLTDAVPTSLSADANFSSVDVDSLKGEALDQAVADADIEGRSTMTADEKRKALRDQTS